MDTLLWMLVNGCTPNRVRDFMEYRSTKSCQRDLDNFERHYAAKVVADALDDVEDREA